jgi:hypothetical protein
VLAPTVERVIGSHTIVVHTSGTDPATIVLAAFGVGLALLSLFWQAFSFVATGSRVSVEVKAGLRGVGAVATLAHTATAQEVAFMQSQGFTDPVVAVKVNNTGRGSTSVADVDLLFDDGGAIGNAVHDPPVPFRLIGESEQTWYFDLRLANRLRPRHRAGQADWEAPQCTWARDARKQEGRHVEELDPDSEFLDGLSVGTWQ